MAGETKGEKDSSVRKTSKFILGNSEFKIKNYELRIDMFFIRKYKKLLTSCLILFVTREAYHKIKNRSQLPQLIHELGSFAWSAQWSLFVSFCISTDQSRKRVKRCLRKKHKLFYSNHLFLF